MTLRTCNILNPASLLPQTGPKLTHDCEEVTQQVYSSKLDLKSSPRENAELEWFTEGSSFVKEGKLEAGCVVVSITEVVEAKALLSGCSAQGAELTVLIRALELGKGKVVNIYSDSK